MGYFIQVILFHSTGNTRRLDISAVMLRVSICGQYLRRASRIFGLRTTEAQNGRNCCTGVGNRATRELYTCPKCSCVVTETLKRSRTATIRLSL